MAHRVKCPYCGQIFDRDNVPCKKVSKRRYAHVECAEKYEKDKTQEDIDLENLKEYIKKIFNKEHIDNIIEKQIETYHKNNGYSYSGIHKTLYYWFEIKKNPIEKSNGRIGIVPYVYEDANNYFYRLHLIQSKNKNNNIYKKSAEKVVKIASPQQRMKQVKLFNLD